MQKFLCMNRKKEEPWVSLAAFNLPVVQRQDRQRLPLFCLLTHDLVMWMLKSLIHSANNWAATEAYGASSRANFR